MFSPKRSIAPRLAFELAGITTLVLAVTGAIAFALQTKEAHRRLEARTNAAINQLSAALSLPLWNFQGAVVDRILASAMESEDVAGVIVRQPNVALPGGVEVFGIYRDAQWQQMKGFRSARSDELAVRRTIVYDGKQVGSLELITTTRWVDARLRSELSTFAAFALMLDVLLVAGLFAMLRREIVKPLQAIEEFAERVTSTSGNLPAPPVGRFHGELDRLRTSIGAMLRLLHDRYMELKSSEELFRASFDSASVGLCLVGLDGKFIRVNPALCAKLGYTEAELCERTFNQVTHPEDRAAGSEFVSQVLEGRAKVAHFEKRYVHKNGQIVWAAVSSALVDQGEGRGKCLITYIRNTTVQKLAEAQLRASEERYRLIAENTSDVIWLYDLKADAFSYVSPSILGQRGYHPEEIVGQRLTQSLPPEAAEHLTKTLLQPPLRPISPLPRNFSIEVDLPHKDARMVPTEIVASLLRDAAGEPVHLLGIARDITERRQAQQARDAVINLAREKQVSELKSQFISVASHEFRTPLTSAIGSLEMLQRHAGKLTEVKRQELIGRIQRSLGRLTEIMNDVLLLSRADSGRVKVTRIEANLVRFAKDILQDIESGDGQAHRFVFAFAGGPETVPVDTKLTNHVLSNLVSNAARYSPAGTSITVSLHIDETAFAFTVADEGIGIPAVDRERIFEPFARGSNVGQIGGTGLGLNIVKRYTELMDGRIELLPTERGATFRFTVPLYPATA